MAAEPIIPFPASVRHRRAVLVACMIVVGVLGVGMRGMMVSEGALATPDSTARYEPMARNLAAGRGWSVDHAPPFMPRRFDQPAYPTALAATYLVVGESRRAVALLQAGLELGVLALLFVLTRTARLPRLVSVTALSLALLCPVLPMIARMIWSETLATLALTAGCAMSVRLIHGERRFALGRWVLTGVVIGAGLLTRADLVIAGVLLALTCAGLALRDAGRRALPGIAGLCVGVLVVLTPWAARNYHHFGELTPLGRAWNQADRPYARWLGTWATDVEDIDAYWWYLLAPGAPTELPEDKFPSQDERVRAEAALALSGGKAGVFQGEVAAEFDRLAQEAVAKRPLRTLLVVPLTRLASSWGNMTYPLWHEPWRTLANGSWVLFLASVVVGSVIGLRRRPRITLLLLAAVGGRCALPLVSALAAEPRYLVEALPVCFVLAAFCVGGKTRAPEVAAPPPVAVLS